MTQKKLLLRKFIGMDWGMLWSLSLRRICVCLDWFKLDFHCLPFALRKVFLSVKHNLSIDWMLETENTSCLSVTLFSCTFFCPQCYLLHVYAPRANDQWYIVFVLCVPLSRNFNLTYIQGSVCSLVFIVLGSSSFRWHQYIDHLVTLQSRFDLSATNDWASCGTDHTGHL